MSSVEEPTSDYLLSDWQQKVAAEVRRVLQTPSALPFEFLGYLGPYLETQNIQLPKAQVIGIASAEIPTGGILAYGAASAPTGWILCDGSAVSRASHALLFDAIGTTYGVGDGSTTFNVPDLRQRFPLGKAASGTGATLGGTGGNIDHTHSVSGTTGNNASFASLDQTNPTFAVATNTHNHTFSATSGSGNPPFQTVTYIIKAV